MAYNVSNLYEGVRNIHYGSIGDPYTTAQNPIRDTIFQGDRYAYEIFGLASQGLYSLAVPVAKLSVISSNASATVSMKVSVIKEVAIDTGVDLGAENVATLTGMGEVESILFQTISGLVANAVTPDVTKIDVDTGSYKISSKPDDVSELSNKLDDILPVTKIDDTNIKTNFDNEIPRTGDEWNKYLQDKYGADNVSWVSEGGTDNSWYKPDGSINYPPNNGAVIGTEVNMTLKPGDILGRYGNVGVKSNFVTQTGADASKLALPPNNNPAIYQEFEVIKEIPETIQAEIAPWGGSSGGGLQYELPKPILQLIKEGYIVPK